MVLHHFIRKIINDEKGEDPYEEKYNQLYERVQVMYTEVATALLGHPEVRQKVIIALEKAIDGNE